jgi:hypothetical protein
VLRFLYTGRCTITLTNAAHILHAAATLRVSVLEDAAWACIKGAGVLTDTDVLELLTSSVTLTLPNLTAYLLEQTKNR